MHTYIHYPLFIYTYIHFDNTTVNALLNLYSSLNVLIRHNDIYLHTLLFKF